MGNGSSGIGGGSGTAGSTQLNPLPDNVIGGKRKIFHDTMNSTEARGVNRVKFSTGDMEDVVEYGNGWAAKGSYEILKNIDGQDTAQRISGEITAFNNRLFGIQSIGDEYRITDLRSGMIIGADQPSKYKVWNAILTFNDMLSKPNNKKLVESGEARFKKAHK